MSSFFPAKPLNQVDKTLPRWRRSLLPKNTDCYENILILSIDDDKFQWRFPPKDNEETVINSRHREFLNFLDNLDFLITGFCRSITHQIGIEKRIKIFKESHLMKVHGHNVKISIYFRF